VPFRMFSIFALRIPFSNQFGTASMCRMCKSQWQKISACRVAIDSPNSQVQDFSTVFVASPDIDLQLST
jgi:hypothetical protein